jgi:hypothetical protein
LRPPKTASISLALSFRRLGVVAWVSVFIFMTNLLRIELDPDAGMTTDMLHLTRIASRLL